MKHTIEAFANSIHADNARKGFWDDEREVIRILEEGDEPQHLIDAVKKAFTAQKLMLIVSEVSEALEADRKDLNDDKLTHRSGLEVELADTAIRIFDMAGGYNMDLGGAIEEKLDYNRGRPWKHGKAY